ncbi:MAG: hypothetical protein LBU65_00015 [Planctomycetaceae bacterium]|jgi:hypothetical protein|nr:hypothetical protein [Planctomycetaceae bacterium]
MLVYDFVNLPTDAVRSSAVRGNVLQNADGTMDVNVFFCLNVNTKLQTLKTFAADLHRTNTSSNPSPNLAFGVVVGFIATPPIRTPFGITSGSNKIINVVE